MVPVPMKSNTGQTKPTSVVSDLINENLREVFAQYAEDDMPDQMKDLLSILRAQDDELEEGDS